MSKEAKIKTTRTMKLEIKHLAPYLPYKVKMEFHGGDIFTLHGLTYSYNSRTKELEPVTIREGNQSTSLSNLKFSKPILRPLSDLTKEIEHNGERFVPLDKLKERWPYFVVEENSISWELAEGLGVYVTSNDFEDLNDNTPFWIAQKLFEWHFDVFGLIEKGLAINKNDSPELLNN